MFRGAVGQRLPPPKLFRPDRMAEAVADVVERHAPVGRRKYVEKRFKMSPDDARRVVEGRASKAQLDRMFREGGWGFVIEVFAEFFDRGLDQHLAEEARRHAKNAERLGAISRDLRALADPGRGAPGGVAGPTDRHPGADRRRVGAGPASRSD